VTRWWLALDSKIDDDRTSDQGAYRAGQPDDNEGFTGEARIDNTNQSAKAG